MRIPCKATERISSRLVVHLGMALFIIFGSAAQGVLAVETNPVDVLRVIDGDTIEVAADLGGQRLAIPVRFLHVDTPERRGKHAMAEGDQAKAFVEELLPDGVQVVLRGPHDELERDRYGRILALVLTTQPDRPSINAQIIQSGHSVYWRKYGEASEPLHEALLKAQQTAESEQAGAWASNPKWMRDKANERTAPGD